MGSNAAFWEQSSALDYSKRGEICPYSLSPGARKLVF